MVVVSAGFEPGFRGGGPIRSVTGLVDDYAGPGHVLVVTRDRDLGDTEPYAGLSGRTVIRSERVSVFYGSLRRPSHWLILGKALAGRRFEVLYLNSFFSPVFSLLPQLAVQIGLLRPARVVVSPRGELMTGALHIKARRKRLLLEVWKRLLGRRVSVHATSEIEREQIARALPGVPVVVVEVAPPRHSVPPTVASTDRVLNACFVGRVSPKKNLLTALQALRGVRQPVRFDVYGPLEDPAYWSRCLDEVARMPEAVEVTYRGELEHDQVSRTFAGHDAFVFPTLGENYGHVVAESLSSSCPVVLGSETPWTDVIRDGGGWLIDAGDVPTLTRVWEDLASMTTSERTRRKQQAREAFIRHLAHTRRTSVLDVLESQHGASA